MEKNLEFTFCALVATAFASTAALLGHSGNTAAPRTSDIEPVPNTATVSRDEENTGAASLESGEFNAEIEAEDTDGQKLKVMANFYPMYGFAVETGGDRAEVADMVPAGIEPRDREPAATDIENLEETDLFVYSGAGMEHWADDVLASLETKRLASMEASAGFTLRPEHSHDEEEHKGVEEHTEGEKHDRDQFDPHIWLSPVNARREVENIKSAHIKADPDNKDYYEDNYKTYTVRFDELNQEYKDILSALPGKSVIMLHEAFGYLYDTYGLTQMGIARLPPNTGPDPARVAKIIDFVKTNHVKATFFEELVSPKVVETIVAEVGARTRVLSPLEGLSDEELKNGTDYFTITEDNLKQLKAALE